MGLIDISDMTLSVSPLSGQKRVRNLYHLLRYQRDLRALEQFGADRFHGAYVSAAASDSASERDALRSAIDTLIANLKSGTVRIKKG